MSVLADHEIRRLCDPLRDASGLTEFGLPPMLDPFEYSQIKQHGDERVVSYGLTSFGYDMRAGYDWKIFTDFVSESMPFIDPKQPQDQYFRDIKAAKAGERIIIPPNSYALTHSIEKVCMPRDVMAICLGKSTYARIGLHVNVTPLEPGWEGQVTIEVSNSTRMPIAVYAGEGIMQVLFFRGSAPEVTYADRKGKYQGQQGITLAKV